MHTSAKLHLEGKRDNYAGHTCIFLRSQKKFFFVAKQRTLLYFHFFSRATLTWFPSDLSYHTACHKDFFFVTRRSSSYCSFTSHFIFPNEKTRTYFVQWPAAEIRKKQTKELVRLMIFLLYSKKNYKNSISLNISDLLWSPKGDSKYKVVHLSLWF